jgi:uncharacterized membrane protein YdjX (TVP38/TMEM64 family)
VPQQPEENPSRLPLLRKWIVACLLIGSVAVVFFTQRDARLLQMLLNEQAHLTLLLAEHPLLILTGAFVLYVLSTGLSLPGATVLVSFASTTGASGAFLLARYLFRETVARRLGSRLSRLDETLRSEGPFYLFALRLIPVVPFFVINLAMGLSPLRLGTFWWVSQVGMLPGTIAYVVVGASLPDLKTVVRDGAGELLTPPMVIALAILGLLPLGARLLIQWWRGRNESHH